MPSPIPVPWGWGQKSTGFGRALDRDEWENEGFGQIIEEIALGKTLSFDIYPIYFNVRYFGGLCAIPWVQILSDWRTDWNGGPRSNDFGICGPLICKICVSN